MRVKVFVEVRGGRGGPGAGATGDYGLPEKDAET